MTTLIDLMGKRFGILTVIGKAPSKGKGALWRVRCDCGKESVAQSAWLRNKAESCGCLAGKKTAERFTTHGLSRAPEYRNWRRMMQRCYVETDHKYPEYGGRGIKVSDRWHDVREFVADMGPRPKGATLDRIDNNGDYAPGNCRWATWSEQANNRRNNRLITFKGETRTVAEWATAVGIKDSRLRNRIARGWPIEEALYGRRPANVKGAA